MECKKQANIKGCNCTYEPCGRKGRCCDCLRYHLVRKELPACCFPDSEEKEYNRSFEKFAGILKEGKI